MVGTFYDESVDLISHWLDHNEAFERHIFTQVAGVAHQNRDGTFRQTILTICRPLDRLLLERELDNPVSDTAVAVKIETGEQIGYLNARLGEDTCSRMKKGEHWIAFVVRIIGRDSDCLGATIVIVKLKEENTASPKPKLPAH